MHTKAVVDLDSRRIQEFVILKHIEGRQGGGMSSFV